jgi:tetratricopeptide (TPR) repeat protein
MNCPALRILVILGAVAMLLPAPLTFSGPAKDQEMLNQAKILMMEQKWEEARQSFQRLIREFPQSNLLVQAYYHSAYCLRLQRKPEEALLAYELFLQKYPKELTLVTEAGKAVVDLGVSLVEQGKTAYRSRLVTALESPVKEVRYFAAIRGSSLKDRELNKLCIPVLKEIRANEKQTDLVNPASIALLRIDPAALSRTEPPKPAKGTTKPAEPAVKMFYLQIFDQGEDKKPTVEMNFPVSFAQLAIMALDEPTKAEMRKKGFDIDNVWESIKRLSATNILTVRSGPRVVKIWIK